MKRSRETAGAAKGTPRKPELHQEKEPRGVTGSGNLGTNQETSPTPQNPWNSRGNLEPQREPTPRATEPRMEPEPKKAETRNPARKLHPKKPP